MDRVLGRSRPEAARRREVRVAEPSPVVLSGSQTLEVVGESHYQDHLWAVVGGYRRERVRCETQAVLEPEPDNAWDGNAVKVLIDGGLVGYLSREDAAAYVPGLRALLRQHSGPVALKGQVVGGGPRSGDTRMLGVFLDHSPADFGVLQRQVMHIGELRTGLSQAIATDLEDDRYDLSWLDRLSGGKGPQDIATLRRLLEHERDPIDRHFMFGELAACLYRNRDAFASALDEFDAVCREHDADMEVIRAALVEKFGCVPVIDLYRQAAIRCQKTRDWDGARAWAARGLTVYGTQAARPEAVADLQKRLAHAEAKLSTPAKAPAARSAVTADVVLETLTCVDCTQAFERPRTRGRKPQRCPACRGA